MKRPGVMGGWILYPNWGSSKRGPQDACGLMWGQLGGLLSSYLCVGHFVVVEVLSLGQHHPNSPACLLVFMQYGATVYGHVY